MQSALPREDVAAGSSDRSRLPRARDLDLSAREVARSRLAGWPVVVVRKEVSRIEARTQAREVAVAVVVMRLDERGPRVLLRRRESRLGAIRAAADGERGDQCGKAGESAGHQASKRYRANRASSFALSRRHLSLVAQAQVEGPSIVSADPALAQYGVDVIW